jgi:hypothetical protein
MIRLGWVVVGALLVGLAGVVVGCSDGGEPSAEAIAAAEELALAALLREGDLPAGDWELIESGLEEMQSAMPDRSAYWPSECGEVPTETWYEDDLLALRTLNVVPVGGDESVAGRANVTSILMTVMVFENAETLERLLDEASEDAEERYDDECTEALEAQRAAQSFESRTEDAQYGLPDSNGIRTSIVMRSTGEMQTTTETHFFVRGRVQATYVIIESDDSSREIDHQGLLEAFEARVVAAAHDGG